MRLAKNMRRILHTVIAGSCLLLAGTSVSGQTDLLKILTDYADAMIEDGRDDARYGKNTSPLFATMLRRDTEKPVMLPYPQIPVLEKNSEPGHRWLYYTGTNFINIPFLMKVLFILFSLFFFNSSFSFKIIYHFLNFVLI